MDPENRSQASGSAGREKQPSYQASDQFVVRTVAGETLLIPVGAATRNFNGMILLNETGAFLWETLHSPRSESELVQTLLETFETDPETALSDIRDFLHKGLENQLISYIE